MENSPPELAQVIVSSESGLAQSIVADGFALAADEPHPFGSDSGPSPYALLLAGLGACTSMTLRLYAQRKGWDLQRIVLRLRHHRSHAQDCLACETKIGFLDQIEIAIELSGELTAEQRERLLAIAEKCPVHRTLESEIRIHTTLE